MQMEEDKPAIKILKEKPPAEPPPSSEKEQEYEQWITDTQVPAIHALNKVITAHKVSMTDKRYQPQSDKITEDDDIQEHLLDSIRTKTYRTKHPQITKLTIPTPKLTSNTNQ